tara:strand:+ start:204 stop:626 length:423 start_codon:yes stop_codon:yes gene_type:complete
LSLPPHRDPQSHPTGRRRGSCQAPRKIIKCIKKIKDGHISSTRLPRTKNSRKLKTTHIEHEVAANKNSKSGYFSIIPYQGMFCIELGSSTISLIVSGICVANPAYDKTSLVESLDKINEAKAALHYHIVQGRRAKFGSFF